VAAPRPRPAGVPPTASWVEAVDEWRQCASDETGRPHGPFRSWRGDGSTAEISRFEHGKQVGVSFRLHRDGSLFSVAPFVDGIPRGDHRRYASDHPGAEQLQRCCVPPGAWQFRQRYDSRGMVDDGAWFDRAGGRLLSTGEPYPDRPEEVPAEASFDENLGQWEAGVIWDQTGYTGVRRRWSLEGVLRLGEGLSRGKRHGAVRIFAEDGAPTWEGHYADGRLSGPFAALELPAEHLSPVNGDAIVRLEGMFERDQAVGAWRAFDAAGTLRQARELGVALDAEALSSSPALADVRRSAEAWRALAGSLLTERRVGESLLAMARAASAASDVKPLTDALAEAVIPLGPAAARTEARELIERASEDLVALIDGLKRGGDAATLLWSIARAMTGHDRAAIELVTAAILLDPRSTAPLGTRALLHVSLGEVAAARADLELLPADAADQRELLGLTLRAYFPRFDFWPAHQALRPLPDDPVPVPERTAQEVRDAIQRYATRLDRLREAVRALRPPDAASLIPDLAHLLPDGPVRLARWTFTMSAAMYEGQSEEPTADGETVELTVDETRELAPDGATLLQLLRRARVDWSGLTWLCWAVGLDAPALPVAIQPPAALGRAAVMTMERVWRSRDRLTTGGLLALNKGIPGFDWEGVPIDRVPVTLAKLALDEYVELRAVLSWLCDAVNRSPWQDDLRGAD
jgi:antitoxin component YwqK of YwqJK toxin-antitoxin module